MSNYSKVTDFAAKDSLDTGNPAKIVKGVEINDELVAISSAIATKADKSSPEFTGTVTGADLSLSGGLTVAGATSLQGVTATSLSLASSIVFEGATADDYETTITITDPTADRTITIPNKTGTVALTSDIPASAATTVSGSYSISGSTTLTVTSTAHGRAVGDTVYLNFTSGTAVDDFFTIVSSADANTFTVTYGSSITTSGDVYVNYSTLGLIRTASSDEAKASVGGGAITPVTLDAVLDDRFTVTGSAPTFLARAWVFFSGSVNNDLSGNWSRSGTDVTVTMTSHGAKVGHKLYLNFNATVADGVYEVVSVTDANTFNVTSATSGTASGTVISTRQTIRNDGNVAYVSRQSTGDYLVNFDAAMPSEYYGFAFTSSSGQSYIDAGTLPTTMCFRMQTTDSAGTASSPTLVSAIVVG